ncbi:MAG: D-galactarate dehydratase [Paracoccaceae bacterium]
MTRAILALPLLLAACASPSLQGTPFAALQPEAPTPDAPLDSTDLAGMMAPEPAQTLDPTPPPPPPPEARTAAEFDTTTEEDRAEAVAAPAPEEVAAERALGTTLATLGSPTDPGIWVKTPAVDALTPGRAVYEGASVNLELRPLDAEAGSGSQVSLPAMRLLGAPLVGIVELELFAAPVPVV